ncbi:MAG TPA: hypothetical protein VIL92_09200 [Gaiellaceae bacterium]
MTVALVAGEGLEDRLRREPLMDEQRQGRDVERQPLGLTGPVEERRAECLQSVDCVLEPADLDAVERSRLREAVRRIEFRRLLDLGEEPFPQLARGILAVPIEGRGERRVVPVPLWRLLLLELRLGADIGPKQRFVGVLVGGRFLLTLGRCQVPLLGSSLSHPILSSVRSRQELGHVLGTSSAEKQKRTNTELLYVLIVTIFLVRPT